MYQFLPTNRFSERVADLLNGTGQALNISFFAVGNGGASEGEEITPSADMTSLVNEIWRGGVESVYKDDEQAGFVFVDCKIPENDGPFWFSEIGLFDDGVDNDGVPELMVIGSYARTQKINQAEQGVLNDISITIAIPVTPAESDVIQLVINPYFHDLNQKSDITHKHTGLDTSEQIEHDDLLNNGTLSHIQIEHKISDYIPQGSYISQGMAVPDWDRIIYKMFFFNNAGLQYCIIKGSAIFTGDYTGKSGNYSIGLRLIKINQSNWPETIEEWSVTTANHYGSLLGEKHIQAVVQLEDRFQVALEAKNSIGEDVRSRLIEIIPVNIEGYYDDSYYDGNL
jgi:hypothetical protein